MKNNCIILIGMAGVGKSTVGKILARKLNYRFIDLDEVIAVKWGKSLQEIIDESGEPAFKCIEKECMHEAPFNRTVIAPGGSIIYHDDLKAYLSRRSTLVYLEDTYDSIAQRIGNPADRGIVGLRGKTLRELFAERVDRYADWADILVDCRLRSPDEVAASVLSRWSAESAS